MKNPMSPITHTLNPNLLLTTRFPISSPTFTFSSPPSPPFTLKCSSQDNTNGSLKSTLSGMVDKRVEELLKSEENKELLDGLEKASLRVDAARKELQGIKRKEAEAVEMKKYVDYLERRESEIAECQKEMSEARLMVDEAERNLSSDLDGVDSQGAKADKDRERLESVKAGAIAAVIGTLAGIPISFSQVSSTEQLILPLAITFISCALFGVTFRYTVRRDLDDSHLKTGTAAAFGVVKGLAAVGAGQPLELNTASFFSHAIDGAVYVSEDLLIFVSAAVGLDYCFKMGFLSPFRIKNPNSQKT